MIIVLIIVYGLAMAKPHHSNSRRTGRRPDASRRGRKPSLTEAAAIHYLNPESLRRFLTERGKIKSRAQTGLNKRDQARLAREVKRAREIALLPYVAERRSDGRQSP